jgi:ABC-type amino acid transport substrate-binding protein
MPLSFHPAATARFLLALLTLPGICGAAACNAVYPLTLDSRYDYDWEVLRAALEKTATPYAPCTLHASKVSMEESRANGELAAAGGRINVFSRSTTLALEQQFLPVRIPVDKGLLGYRLLLVRAADLPRFAEVRTLQDLRALRAGQGSNWADVAILRAAGIPVVEGNSYDGLFSMLMARRFDYFSRALDEALREIDEHRASHPQMALEPGLLLYYPLPRYFFVRRDAEGRQLAQRIAAGLEIMIRDGTLDQLFQRYKGKSIEQADLPHRRLIKIDNPGLPPETPLSRSELWYNPLKSGLPALR